jgi:hypothetical protein
MCGDPEWIAGSLLRPDQPLAQAYMAFLTQSVACNALHSVDERLAGWLLTSHDRMGQDDFPLTQDPGARARVCRSLVTLALAR